MARTYEQLTKDYRISRSGLKVWESGVGYVPINSDDYDVIIEDVGAVYAGRKYRIIKKPNDISSDELCAICDKGGYNFGYRYSGSYLTVYID